MPSLLEVVGFEMEMVWVPIIVAIISGPLVVILQKLRKENTEQHAEGRILLKMIGSKVDKIGSRLDNHIGWHEGKKED
jgi:hypothetical protein